MSDILSSCPFCGSADIDFAEEMGGNRILYFRFCVGCGAQGPMVRNETEARPAWNRRVNTLNPVPAEPASQET